MTKKAVILAILSASFAYACSCSHCAGCRTIMPAIKKSFKAVKKKFKSENESMAKEYSKIVDIEKATRLMEMRTNNNMKEMTYLQFELDFYEKKLEYLYEVMNGVVSLEKDLEILDKGIRSHTLIRNLDKIYKKESE